MDREINRFRWALIASLLTIAVLLAYCFDFTVGGTEESILNTLARAQAAIFAIVFSVLILGVRLSASRYSPRLVSTFRSDFGYVMTVGVFGVSIGFDVTMLFILDVLSQFQLTILLFTALGLAVGAFWTMWDFVNDTLEKTTPEGILTYIEGNLSPSAMMEAARSSAEDPTERGPFLVLVKVILSTISEKDRSSADLGLDILGDRTSALISNAPDEELEEDSPVDQSIEELCVEQLPNIAQEAVNEGLTQTAEKATETAETIGETGINVEQDNIVIHVVRGLSELINDFGYERNMERVRNKAIDKSSNILKESADNGVWNGGAIGARYLSWLSAASIMNRTVDSYNRGYTSLLILCFPKLVSKAVDSEADLNDHPPSQWLRALRIEEIQSEELMIASCYSSMSELTSAAVRYEIRNEERMVRWDLVSAGWSEAVSSVSGSELTAMKKLWLSTALYLEYLCDVTPSGVMEDFYVHGLYEEDRDFAEETIADILQGNIKPRKEFDMIPGEVDPVEMPLTGSRRPPVIDPDIEFSEWLEHRKVMFR